MEDCTIEVCAQLVKISSSSFKIILLSLVTSVCMDNRINDQDSSDIGSNVHNANVLIIPSSKGSISTGKVFMVLSTLLLLQPAIGREKYHQEKTKY